jgi:small subunit ribosomal protein S16
MLRIRLSRTGKKGQPAYKIVVAEQSKAVKKQAVEKIGSFNPSLNPSLFILDQERYDYWVDKGAQATDRVKTLIEKNK